MIWQLALDKSSTLCWFALLSVYLYRVILSVQQPSVVRQLSDTILEHWVHCSTVSCTSPEYSKRYSFSYSWYVQGCCATKLTIVWEQALDIFCWSRDSEKAQTSFLFFSWLLSSAFDCTARRQIYHISTTEKIKVSTAMQNWYCLFTTLTA